VTTRDPGERLVLTQGRDRRPRKTAFLARSAAATMTEGFEVLVHDVIATMATTP
jgi:hypothetical protein